MTHSYTYIHIIFICGIFNFLDVQVVSPRGSSATMKYKMTLLPKSSTFSSCKYYWITYIYRYIYTHTLYIYIYIYVCVCLCARLGKLQVAFLIFHCSFHEIMVGSDLPWSSLHNTIKSYYISLHAPFYWLIEQISYRRDRCITAL